MKKIIAFVTLALTAFVSFPAAAQTVHVQATEQQHQIDCSSIDVTKLSESEIYTIRQACSSVPSVSSDRTINPDAVREWASLGKEFSDAITETASGLGVAANDFLMTPLGMLIAIYFMWDFIGGILVGIPLLIAVIWFYLASRVHMTHYVTYKVEPVFFGLLNKKTISSMTPKDIDISVDIGYLGLCFIVSCIILGFLIF